MTTKTNERQVRAVFANYKVPLPNGGVGLKSKVRGDTIDITTLAEGELERLERNGALMPAGGEIEPDRLEEALTRALNPTDVIREDFAAPLTVSPPSLGAEPRGDFTKGDTGIDPADQPPPPLDPARPPNAAEQEALDRMRAEGQSLPRTDAPDVEDTAALSEFIKTGGDGGKGLTVPETIALAEGDPDRARYVLEAEKAATGQDPRAGVEKGLTKVIEGD